MGLSFLVLILVFRSIMVPLVASVGFPLLGAGELRCRGVDLPVGLHEFPLWRWSPGSGVVVLADPAHRYSFGLAMDYQMFLVTGMREAYVRTARMQRPPL